MSRISPLAYIHPDARLGENIVVEPFAVIHDNVIIGNDCYVASHAVIHAGARIGNNCRIFTGAVVSSIPQDLKFQNEDSTVEIGDNVTIREYATINRGTVHSHKTVIGNNCLIMSYAHVAHDCQLGKNVILVNTVNLAGHVVIDDFAVIGGTCAVHQFCKIGKHVMVAGGCIVRKDIPPYVLAGRDPLSYVGINTTGLRRRGFKPEQIADIQEVYRLIFLSDMSIRIALEAVERLSDNQYKDEITAFIRTSDRGILKGYRFSDNDH